MSSERKNIIFDSTILNNLQLCAQKIYLAHELNLHPIGPNPHYLDEGDLLHRMLEFYNLVLRDTGTEVLYDNEKFVQLQKAVSEFGQFISTTLDLQPVEASEVIYQFNEFTKFTRMDGVKILEAERPFMVELYKDEDLGVYYTGKIDRYTDTPNYGHVPRDYKSGGQRKVPSTLSNQFTGYAFSTNSDIIIVDKVGFQKTLKPQDRFNEHPLYYNAYKKEEWKQDTIWWAKQYAFYLETNTWPRNRTSCDKWAGCQYERICDANDDEFRQHIIKTEFHIGDAWDVTKYLKKDTKPSEERLKMAEIAGNYGIDMRLI
jgi:hypothetical protein